MTSPVTKKEIFSVCEISAKYASASIPDAKYPLISDLTLDTTSDKDVFMKETEDCVEKKKKKKKKKKQR